MSRWHVTEEHLLYLRLLRHHVGCLLASQHSIHKPNPGRFVGIQQRPTHMGGRCRGQQEQNKCGWCAHGRPAIWFAGSCRTTSCQIRLDAGPGEQASAPSVPKASNALQNCGSSSSTQRRQRSLVGSPCIRPVSPCLACLYPVSAFVAVQPPSTLNLPALAFPIPSTTETRTTRLDCRRPHPLVLCSAYPTPALPSCNPWPNCNVA